MLYRLKLLNYRSSRFLSHFHSMSELIFYYTPVTYLPTVDTLPIFYNYITSQRATCVCVCFFSGSYLCSPNFKLITALLARRTRLVIFTLSRGPFHLSCFLPSLSPPLLFSHCFSRSASPLLRCANIIKLSRLYYTATLHFYFLALPPVILNLHAFKYSPISSHSIILSHLYAASPWETLQNCVILLPTVTSTFHPCLPHILLTFPLFSIAPSPHTGHFIIALL